MKRFLLIFVALVLLLTLLPLAPPFVTPVSAQGQVSVSPTSGSIGSLLTVSGSGFTATNSFQVSFGGIIVTNGVVASGGLLIGISFTVPSGVNPGTNVVTVTSGSTTAIAYFELLQGTVEVSPEEGKVGQRVTVKGEGFGRNVTVDVLYDEESVGSRNTTASGTFSLAFTVPPSWAGFHDILAETTAADRTDPVGFEVKPSLTAVSPTEGPAGTVITISGKGFAGDDEAVTVYLGVTKVGTVPSNEFGTIADRQLTIGEFPGGTWSVKATDFDSNSATAETKFTVEPDLTVSPTGGNVGTQVEVSGTGFLGNKAITVALDDTALTPVTPIKSGSNGSFSGNFFMPKTKSGAHTVTITDGANSASTTWMMESNPSPKPTLRTPINNAKIGALKKEAPAFSWAEVTDPSGVTYEFQIAEDVSFALPVLSKEDLEAASYALSPIEALDRGHYFWRVRAIDGAGNASPWSTAWGVQIGWPIPIWVLVLLGILAVALIFLFVVFISRSMVPRV